MILGDASMCCMMYFKETFLSDQENSLLKGGRLTSLGRHANMSEALWTRPIRTLLSTRWAGLVQLEPITTTTATESQAPDYASQIYYHLSSRQSSDIGTSSPFYRGGKRSSRSLVLGHCTELGFEELCPQSPHSAPCQTTLRFQFADLKVKGGKE